MSAEATLDLDLKLVYKIFMFHWNLLSRPREQTPPEPFVIRGHHLKIFAQLLRRECTVGQFARSERRFFEGQRQRMQWNTGHFAEDLKYYADFMGTTGRESRQVEHSSREVYREFLELSDRHPAEVVVALADMLCGACIVGEHCSSRKGWVSGDDYVNTIDRLPVLQFRQTVKQLGLEHDMTIVTRMAEFNNAPPVEVECVITTCGTARTVLASDAFRR